MRGNKARSVRWPPRKESPSPEGGAPESQRRELVEATALIEEEIAEMK